MVLFRRIDPTHRTLRSSWTRPHLPAAIAVFSGATAAIVGPGALPSAAASHSAHSVEAMPGAIPGYVQTFEDDFSGSALSIQSWTKYWGVPASTLGGCWDPTHDVVHHGELDLETYADPTAIAVDAPYVDQGGCESGDVVDGLVSGGVKLSGLSQTYGIFEVRMRAENAEGVGVAVLLWPTANTWPPEIDFAENNGTAPRTAMQASLHAGKGDAQYQHDLVVNMGQWHTYGVIWSHGKLQYTLDGKVWATTRGAQVPDIPMQLVIQTGAADCGGWEACVNSATARTRTNVDVAWVVVYQSTASADGQAISTRRAGHEGR